MFDIGGGVSMLVGGMAGKEFCLIYVPVSSREEAERIAKEIVERRLAACANILMAGNSFFWWEGKVDKAPETILILKTRREYYHKVAEAVRRLHSYTCPAIIALPVIAINEDYASWLLKETSHEDTS